MLAITGQGVIVGALAIWRVVRAPIVFAFNIIAALVILFEEWGWRPLAALLGQLAQYRPIAAIERWIAGLHPYASLLVFTLPTVLLLPLKFIAMWLLASGKLFAASALFVGAKITSTALVARIFMLTKPALMRIGWFARGYAWFIPWKDALFAVIRASWVWRYGRVVKTRVMRDVTRISERLKPVWRQASEKLRQRLTVAQTVARVRWQALSTAIKERILQK